MLAESPPFSLAQQALRKNYTSKGVKACETGNFEDERWLRDSVWSLLYAAKAGSQEDLLKTRQVLDDFLRNSPSIPHKISTYNHELLFLFGLKIPRLRQRDYEMPRIKSILNPEVRHLPDRKLRDSFLILMLAGNYLSSSNLSQEEKQDFWLKHESHIKNFLHEYLNKYASNDLLVTEYPFSTRRDCIKTSGITHQTNVFWYKTIMDLAEGVRMHDEQYTQYLRNIGETIKKIQVGYFGKIIII